MTQSLPPKNTQKRESASVVDSNKSFLDLSTVEMEQLMKIGVTQAKKRMHDKGISTIASVEGDIYEERPDGTRILRHSSEIR